MASVRQMTSEQFIEAATKDDTFVGNLDYVEPDKLHSVWPLSQRPGYYGVEVTIKGQNAPAKAMVAMSSETFEALPKVGE